MELGHTSYVILGMLRKGAKSGYEIKAKADISTRFFWAISYGQIYPELKRLEQGRLIEGASDKASGRQRREYRITQLGEDALHAWLTDDGELHSELRHEGVLRFFFADALDAGERQDLLNRLREKHEAMRRELERIQPVAQERSQESGDPFPLLTLKTGIAYQTFFIDLCDRLEQSLAEQPITGGS
jgi:DNA-binding PadR family transcriptional regulator